jgi:predicted enzyme related to lactoylglutathione lyase
MSGSWVLCVVLVAVATLGWSAEPAKAVEIDKITIAVADLAKMKGFYGRALGIEFTDIDMQGAKLAVAKLGALEILLCPKQLAGITATENTVQLRFVVADVKAAHAAAVAAGGASIAEPQDGGGRLTSAVRDPDGNSLELIERR